MEIEYLTGIIADVMHIDQAKIKKDDKFIDDLGADSLDVLEIITKVEDEFGIQVSDEAASKIVTVEDAYKAIKNELEQ